MDLDKWATAYIREVHENWLGLVQRSPCYKSGYSVFYSPVVMHPGLMVIGYNPGGGSDSFDPTREQQLSTKHDYFVSDYPLARRMRRLFESIGKTSLLASSVKTNMIFFRTRNVDEWNSIELRIRKDLRRFCLEKNIELIRIIQPSVVLTEGIDTYSILKQELRITGDDVLRFKGRSLFIKNHSSSPKLLGMIHPSGARVSNDEWKLIQERLILELP